MGELQDAKDGQKHKVLKQFLHISKNSLVSAYISTVYWPDDIHATVQRFQNNLREPTFELSIKYGR